MKVPNVYVPIQEEAHLPPRQADEMTRELMERFPPHFPADVKLRATDCWLPYAQRLCHGNELENLWNKATAAWDLIRMEEVGDPGTVLTVILPSPHPFTLMTSIST